MLPRKNIILGTLVIVMIVGMGAWYWSEISHTTTKQEVGSHAPREGCAWEKREEQSLKFSLLVDSCSDSTTTSSDPIAARLESCEDANQSTGGVTNCIQAATEAYHAALDMSYADLMAKLPATQKSILEETQTAWTAYKDKEMLLLREFYAARKGTMYIPMGANDVMTIWKTRAKTLKGYSQVLGIES